MKKLAALTAIAVAMGFGIQAQAFDLVDKVVLYIPNRIVEATDLFSLELGFGPAIKADVSATKAFDFGAGVGPTAKVVKGYNRQYGFSLDKGYSLGFTCITAQDIDRSEGTNNVQNFSNDSTGLPDCTDRLYDIYNGPIDYWSVGGEVACGVDAGAYIHPVNIADFVTGIFLYDLKGNDFTLDNTRY